MKKEALEPDLDIKSNQSSLSECSTFRNKIDNEESIDYEKQLDNAQEEEHKGPIELHV